MSDIILSASVSFVEAGKEVDRFVEQSKKKLSTIMASANGPGGSNSGGFGYGAGASGGGGGGGGNYKSPIITQNKLDAAAIAVRNKLMTAQQKFDETVRRDIVSGIRRTAAETLKAQTDAKDALKNVRLDAERDNQGFDNRARMSRAANRAFNKDYNAAILEDERRTRQADNALRANAERENQGFDNRARMSRAANRAFNKDYNAAILEDERRTRQADNNLRANAERENQGFDNRARATRAENRAFNRDYNSAILEDERRTRQADNALRANAERENQGFDNRARATRAENKAFNRDYNSAILEDERRTRQAQSAVRSEAERDNRGFDNRARSSRAENRAFNRDYNSAILEDERRTRQAQSALRSEADRDNQGFDNRARQSRAEGRAFNRDYNQAVLEDERRTRAANSALNRDYNQAVLEDERRTRAANSALHADAERQNQGFDNRARATRAENRAFNRDYNQAVLEDERRTRTARNEIYAEASRANQAFDIKAKAEKAAQAAWDKSWHAANIENENRFNADYKEAYAERGRIEKSGNTNSQTNRNANALGVADRSAFSTLSRINRQVDDPGLANNLSSNVTGEYEKLTAAIRQYGAGSVQATAATNGFKRAIVETSAAITEHNGLFKQLRANTESTNASIGSLGVGFGSFRRMLLNTQVAMTALTAAFGIREMVSMMETLQTFENTMKAVSPTAEAAAQNIDFLKKSANELGFSYAETGKSFAQFAAAGYNMSASTDQIQSAFIKVTAAAQNFGLSSADTEGVIRALTQSMSKGRFSAEELRQQLGDRMPIAMAALEKATGKSGDELEKMMKAGHVGVSEYMIPFVNAMYAMSGGIEATERTSKSFTASIARMKNAFADLIQSSSEGTFGAGLTTMINSLEQVIKSDFAAQFIALIGNAMDAAGKAITMFVEGPGHYLSDALKLINDNWSIVGAVAFGAAFTALIPILYGATTAMLAFTASTLTNPLAWVVVGVSAAAAAFVYYQDTLVEIGGVQASVFNIAKSALMNLGEVAKGIAGEMWDYWKPILAVAKEAMPAAGEAIVKLFMYFGEQILKLVDVSVTFARNVGQTFDVLVEGIFGNFSTLGFNIAQIFRNLLDNVYLVTGTIGKAFSAINWNDIKNGTFKGNLSAIFSDAFNTGFKDATANTRSFEGISKDKLTEIWTQPGTEAGSIFIKSMVDSIASGTSSLAEALSKATKAALDKVMADAAALQNAARQDAMIKAMAQEEGSHAYGNINQSGRQMLINGTSGLFGKPTVTEDPDIVAIKKAVSEKMQDLQRKLGAAMIDGAADQLMTTSLNALADAAERGDKSINTLNEQAKVRAMVTARLNAESDLYQKQVMRQIDADELVASGYLKSAEAGAKAEAAAQAYTLALKYTTESLDAAGKPTGAYAVEIDRITTALLGLKQAQQTAGAAKLVSTNRDELEYLRAQSSLITSNTLARDQELAALKAAQQFRFANPLEKAAAIQSARDLVAQKQATDQMNNSWQELANLGSQAFDRIGSAITDAFAKGKGAMIDFKSVGKAVFSELIQAALKMAVINPILNSIFGGTRGTAGGVIGAIDAGNVGTSGTSAALAAISALTGGDSSTAATSTATAATAATAVGSLSNAQQAVQFFVGKGWTPAQAAGIVGNLQQESGPNLNTSALNSGENAQGIAQWRGSRILDFVKQTGSAIGGSSLMTQLGFVNWELNNTEKVAGDKLRATTTLAGATSAVDSAYERSSGAHLSSRLNYATQLASSYIAPTAAATVQTASPSVGDNGLGGISEAYGPYSNDAPTTPLYMNTNLLNNTYGNNGTPDKSSGAVSYISDLLGLAKSSGGVSFSGVSGMVDSVGISSGLFGNGLAAGTVGPTLSGAPLQSVSGLFGTGTASATLGAVGAGVGVGMVAGGITSGMVSKARGGSVGPGGQIGTIAGAVGGAVLGFMIGGPVGAIIGGGLGGGAGGAAGASFGPTKKGMRSRAGGNVIWDVVDGQLAIVQADGNRWDKSGSSAEVQASLNDINNGVAERGLTLSGSASYYDRNVGFGLGAERAGSSMEFNSAAAGRMIHSSDPTVQKAIDTTNEKGRGIDAIFKAVDFVNDTYKPLLDTTNAFGKQLKALTDPFNAAIYGARDLGISETELVAARDKATDALYKSRNAAYDQAVAGVSGRGLRATGGLTKVYNADLKDYNTKAVSEVLSYRKSLEDMGMSNEQITGDMLALDKTQSAERAAIVKKYNDDVTAWTTGTYNVLTNKTNAYMQSLDAVNTQYATAIAAAEDLGMSTEELTASLSTAISAMIDARNLAVQSLVEGIQVRGLRSQNSLPATQQADLMVFDLTAVQEQVSFKKQMIDLGMSSSEIGDQMVLLAAQQGTERLAAVKKYDDLVTAWMTGTYDVLTHTSNAYSVSLQAVSDQYAAAIVTAGQLGIAETDLATARDQVLADMISARNLAVTSLDMGLSVRALRVINTDSSNQTADLMAADLAAAQEQVSFKKSMVDLGMTAADVATEMVKLEDVQGAERLAIIQKYSDAAATAIKTSLDTATTGVLSLVSGISDYITGLRSGSLSPLSDSTKYDMALKDFNTQSGLAAAGNYPAESTLTTYADTFLNASKTMNGSGVQYAADFDKVVAALETVATSTPDTLTASFLANTTQTQTDTLVTSLAAVKDEITALRREVQQSNTTPTRIAA